VGLDLKKLVVALLCSFLLFGCLGGSPAPQTGVGAEQAGAPSTEAQPSTQASTQPSTQPSGSGTPSDWAGLLASGAPYECTVTVETTEGPMSSKVYFSGGNVRMEATYSSGGMTFESVSIIKNEASYSQVTDLMKTAYPDCDWLYSSPKPGEEAVSPNEGTEAYQQPEVHYVCTPWVPDASKFATPGSACDLNELTEGAMGGAGVGAGVSACTGLEGEALNACVEALVGAS
jgi:uncharacterized protein (DUF427 family)